MGIETLIYSGPMRWLRDRLNPDARLWALVQQQHECINELRLRNAEDMRQYARLMRDLLIEIRIALDNSDNDFLYEKLDEAISDLKDTVARDSEHAL